MEAFEITFFCSHDKYDEKMTEVITEQFEKYNTFQKQSIVEVFYDNEKNFVQAVLSIFDFVIPEKKFEATLEKMSQYVSAVFEVIPNILFATGIYELTAYFTDNKKHVVEFDNNFMANFPLIFLRKEHVVEFGEVIYTDANIICVFNKDAQIIIN